MTRPMASLLKFVAIGVAFFLLLVLYKYFAGSDAAPYVPPTAPASGGIRFN